MLMATLVRPVVRIGVAKWRRRARQTGPAAISLPVQQLIEAALVDELSRSRPVPPSPATSPRDDANEMRTVLVVAAVTVVVALSALAIATLIRRRRRARAAPVERPDWVAVRVDASTETVEDAVALEERVE
jgi:hypothetical protein